MNEIERALALICQLLEKTGALANIAADDAALLELRALYVTLARRSRSAVDYHVRPRGVANLAHIDSVLVNEDAVTFPEKIDA